MTFRCSGSGIEMDFERLDDKMRLRNTNYLFMGIATITFAIIMFALPTVVSDKLNLDDTFIMIMYVLGIMLILLGIIVIYFAFMGSMNRFFMAPDGKCALVKNSYCPSGDCRKCVFADTYLKENSKGIGKT